MVELLVALAVAGMVALAAFTMVGFAAESSARLREAGKDATAGATVRVTLEAWLRAAALLDGAAPLVGVNRGDGERSLDEVRFAASDAGPTYPGVHRVRLWVDVDPATPRQGLLAELAPFRSGGPATAETLEVAPAATGLSLRYRMRVVGGERWVDEWRLERLLPLAVELRIEGPGEPARGSTHGGLPPLLLLPIVVQPDQASAP